MGHDEVVKKLTEWLVSECCIDGIRNKSGKYQRINDFEKLKARLENRLTEYFKETCTTLVVS